MKKLTKLSEGIENNPTWIRKKILEFFSGQAEITKLEMETLADTLKLTHSDLNEHIYTILVDIFRYGNYMEKRKQDIDVEINADQLEIGVRFELEHTKCPLISRRIALDHLVSDDKYYTHLQEMEKKYSSK